MKQKLLEGLADKQNSFGLVHSFHEWWGWRTRLLAQLSLYWRQQLVDKDTALVARVDKDTALVAGVLRAYQPLHAP